jgi:chromosome segregation ATPase
MTDFDQLRDELTTHRHALSQQRQAALLARETLQQAERALADFARTEDPQHEGERARLEAAVKNAQARAERARGLLDELGANEGKLWDGFGRFTDPREGLRRWPDRYTILILRVWFLYRL